ncbi:hypothetical protein BDL97_19G029400 [Sphagnum fallax]|nr:hypothetical protein BDL97_19G029400 [Sphagnum fallax]
MATDAAAGAEIQLKPARTSMAAPRGPTGPPRLATVVDREKIGGHHTVEDFAIRGKEPKDEVQIYTWRDATLRELTDLMKEVAPAARKRDARLSFAFVYPDRRGRNVIRNVGMTYVGSTSRRGDDHRTLAELSFQTGDFLDVAIYN